jgi:hypothetical protein
MIANRPATRTGIWSRFATWAWRTLDRVPSCFQDVDPRALRTMRPF